MESSFKLSKKLKKALKRNIIALGLFLVLLVVDKIVNLAGILPSPFGWILPFVLYLGVYIYIAYDVLIKAAKNIKNGQVFDENFLMCIATIGAFALAIYRGVVGQEIEGFDEACAVIIFYQIGEFFQKYATGRARTSISGLMDIRPDYANILRDGETEIVSPDEVNIGDIIVVNPGEKIPLDGIVVKGTSSIDTKALTGESAPRNITEGEAIISGCVNIDTQIEIKVTKAFYDSTVSKILEMVENASDKKSKAEYFITKFARVYTPAVCIAALLLAVVPGIITGNWSIWVYRALSFLVVSCPCALVISIPLSFFAGIGAASKYMILVKGANYLEKFNDANVFVFDKTGTLTKGNFAVSSISPADSKDDILRLAAIAENGSSHPIAKSVLAAFGDKPDGGYTLTNIAGKGVKAEKDGEVILCGNANLMEENGIKFISENGVGTVLYIANKGNFIGSILISDELKEETPEVISALRKSGAKTIMLTGDNEAVASDIAKKAGLTSFKAGLLPQNKVSEVEKLLGEKKPNDVVCFVGDGINDAPVLMRSDIGVAMGGVGSDAAIEAADIVLMKDDLKCLPLAKKIARKTMYIVRENVIFALGVKAVILILSAIGLTGMWIAVFGDVGVAVLCILNAMRANGKY